MDRTMTRRRFLSTTALAGAGAVAFLAASRSAWAFTVAPKNAEAENLYLQACSGKDGAYHRQLVAEVKDRLQGRFSDQQIESAIASMTCPICGCPIATS